ncbi:ATP synthase subunit gamma, mitochondrial [Dermacentor andersoni]|uniref:ATP synthase subunit gamma, mitochondrial n=1 Tax=Dermacentor andersoni TaxID=34620 RepID=UPI0021556214|nr:ATP synthase subunit gamma, mitochondrial-like [Dermacentor andersoni]
MFSALQKVGAFAPACTQARNMATLKDIRMRLKSVKNIQKITQSMKMVSAAKYARAERDLKQVRPYGEGAQAFYEAAEIKPPEGKQKTLIIAMSSDRGLCGAIHSSVAKRIRTMMQEDPQLHENARIICVGDKVRAILQRLYSDNILLSFSDFGKKPPIFDDAVKVANAILGCEYEFDKGILLFNRFKSVVSYTTTDIPVFSLDTVTGSEKITLYDSLDADVLKCYQEYSLASLIYYVMKENSCSEQSARMTAMDGATKNAGEMIDKLTLTFNRTRQAVITKELIEIISGAAAL